MKQKRVLIIQDISCVGKCSMTIALPVLACFGHETCILPTAVLSTHTGGFGTPAVYPLEDGLEPVWRHWQAQEIRFDGILIGYLGSCGAVSAAMDVVERMLMPGGICICDPAMADHGRLYSGLSEEYARCVGALCRRADVILPNQTEAAMLAGFPGKWEKDPLELLAALSNPCTVMTGVELNSGEMGIYTKLGTETNIYQHRRLPGRFHGTGDFFAACFAGALLHGWDIGQAVQLASDLTVECVRNSVDAQDNRFGLRFEPVLGKICKIVQETI